MSGYSGGQSPPPSNQTKDILAWRTDSRGGLQRLPPLSSKNIYIAEVKTIAIIWTYSGVPHDGHYMFKVVTAQHAVKTLREGNSVGLLQQLLYVKGFYRIGCQNPTKVYKNGHDRCYRVQQTITSFQFYRLFRPSLNSYSNSRAWPPL